MSQRIQTIMNTLHPYFQFLLSLLLIAAAFFAWMSVMGSWRKV